MLRNFAALEGVKFDVLICGGGIYGAWTAYDAALRGLKVAVVEQSDWASGTSSASSKLIHGGLRYLKTFDFGLVRKALRERRMLLNVAPHRIWPLRFAIPVFKDSRVGRFRLKMGLMLYDFLAGKHDDGILPHRYFDRVAFARKFPFLNASNLIAGFDYGDAQTDDARLVLEIIDGAVSAGAICLNYCKMMGFVQQKGRISGADVEDTISGKRYRVLASQVVNTAGQWMATDSQQQELGFRLSKGVHLVLPRLPTDEALLLTARSDGRVFFIIPWYGLTLLGTTDTNYKGDINQVIVEQEDVEYLLREANQVLGDVHWGKNDILGQFAGLRVLKLDSGKTVSDNSRDWELKTLDNDLLVSIGGKITSARKDAATIVDKVCRNLGVEAICKTQNRLFPWTPEGNFKTWSSAALDEAKKLGIDHESALWLLRRHGKRIPKIFQLIEKDRHLANRTTPTVPLVLADLIFCAQHEMVVTLEDLFRRRLPLLITSRLNLDELKNLAGIAGEILGWNEATLEKQIQLCAKKWLNRQ